LALGVALVLVLVDFVPLVLVLLVLVLLALLGLVVALEPLVLAPPPHPMSVRSSAAARRKEIRYLAMPQPPFSPSMSARSACLLPTPCDWPQAVAVLKGA